MITTEVRATPKVVPARHLRYWVGLLGFFIVCLLAWLRAHLDLRLEGSRIAYGQLPVGPVVVLLLLLWVFQPFLKRLSRSLTVPELALLFCLPFALTRFWSSSYSVLPLTLPVAPFYYANPANNYDLLQPLVPQHLFPKEKLFIKAFYEGNPSGAVPWDQWQPALLIWTLSTFFLLVSLIGLTLFFYRRWANQEKLIFPIARIVVEMLQKNQSLWKTRALWTGLFVSCLLHSWNGLSHYFPVLPTLNIRQFIKMNALFASPPWAIISYESAPVGIYPSVIGTTYLIPAEVAVGFWLFHLLSYVEMVILFALGLPAGGVDYGGIRAITRSHEIGAFLVFAGVLAIRTWKSQKQTEGVVATRFGLVLFLIGFGGLAFLWTWLGADWWASLGYFIIYFVVCLVLARISCQAGCMFIGMDFHPHNVSGYLFGQTSLGLKNLVVMMFPHMAYMMERDVVPLPYLLNSVHIASCLGLSERWLFPNLIIGGLIASLASMGSSLKVIYRFGGLNLHYHYLTRLSRWAWDKYLGWLRSPAPPDRKATVGIIAGVSFSALLVTCHQRLPGFPVHPLGFALADSLVIRRIWLSVFLGWAVKGIVLRYLGLAVYRSLLPGFIGLVLGELIAAGVWLSVDAAAGKKGHDIFPGFPPL
ncbi:MAG: hypothetical protein NZ959_10115 [Armatimonadetes bacterium]|nr:hypothetical protein [Armatimonadota bacterium]MDW8122604.1 DUF6785 family protein [Armatimonadota bacterium]